MHDIFLALFHIEVALTLRVYARHNEPKTVNCGEIITFRMETKQSMVFSETVAYGNDSFGGKLVIAHVQMDEVLVSSERIPPLPCRFRTFQLLKNMPVFWENLVLLVFVFYVNNLDLHATRSERIEGDIKHFQAFIELDSLR